MKRGLLWGAGLGLLILGGGAGYAVGLHAGASAGSEGAAEAAGPVVAAFAGGELSAETVRARIHDEGPLLADRYATKEGLRELVQGMVRERILLAEARGKKHHLRPAVVRQCDAALLESFLEAEFEEPERQRPISEAELKTYFAAQQQTLSRPAQVRLAHIFLAAPSADVSLRERQRRAASSLLSEVKAAMAREPEAFTSIARRRSEDTRTRALGGELPLMAEPQVQQVLGVQVAGAVFGESKPRGLLEGLIETPEGFHLVAVLERAEATNPSFEQVRELLQPRLARERRDTNHAAFLSALERQAQVRIDEASLDSLLASPGASAGK
ncbi:MAG TPA: peptidylprolyl isomerase [Archangium sp.]|jgi:peptidyl-prolyl cis-trans isomerase C|uniref:peptidylprolyl isomerase n=1 Tax=Archangium sp. TaxID=1872627 RepID=UPI002EDA05D0